jgi:hypothetical protein
MESDISLQCQPAEKSSSMKHKPLVHLQQVAPFKLSLVQNCWAIKPDKCSPWDWTSKCATKQNDCSFNLPAFETDEVTSFPGTTNLPITGCESGETKQPEMGRTVTIDSKYPDTSTTAQRTRQDNHNKIYCSQKKHLPNNLNWAGQL